MFTIILANRMTLQNALKTAYEQLKTDTARLDAEVLLAHVLGKNRTYLFTWPDKELSDTQKAEFERFIAERAEGQPVAYLTGTQEFWSMNFKVSEATLIPRPDTELLVEAVLNTLSNQALTIADFGTGSGAIACALAQERPNWQISAVDQSKTALLIAKENALAHQLSNIHFIQGSWGKPCFEPFDAIVSNPPYIESNDPHLNQGDVAFEPRSALVSGDDGLDDIRLIIIDAKRLLKPGGALFFEHGYNQGEAVRSLLNENGFVDVKTIKDLSGHERVTYARTST